MEQPQKTIYEECSVCNDSVAISYECPNCKCKVCMICAIDSGWKCPKCKQNLNLSA